MADPQAVPLDYPFDPASPFTPGGASQLKTATLPAVAGESQQMAVTIRIPGGTVTVLLDKRQGEQWAANIAETAALLGEPAERPSPNGRQHAHG